MKYRDLPSSDILRGLLSAMICLCITALLWCLLCNNRVYSQNESPSATPYALVASSSKKYIQEGKNLLVLDLSRALNDPTRAIVSQIPVFSQGFALSQGGTLCLSGNRKDNEVVLVDVPAAIASPSEIKKTTITLQSPPAHIEISKGRSIAFVLENNPPVIAVLDMEKAKTNPESCLITSCALDRPVANIIVSPDDNYLLLLGEEIRVLEISRILSGAGNSGIYRVTPRFPPACALFDGKNGLFFLSDISGVVLTIMKSINIKGRLELSEQSFGRAKLSPGDRLSFRAEEQCSVPLHNLSLTPDARYLFMPHPGLNRISVIDLMKTASVENRWGVSQVTTGLCPLQACFTEDGEKALVNNFLSGNIYLLDTRKCVSEPENALLTKVAVPAPCYMEVVK